MTKQERKEAYEKMAALLSNKPPYINNTWKCVQEFYRRYYGTTLDHIVGGEDCLRYRCDRRGWTSKTIMRQYTDTIVKYKPKPKTSTQLDLGIVFKQSSGNEYKGKGLIEHRPRGTKNGKS